MNWLRVASGAFVFIVVGAIIVGLVVNALEEGKAYHGTYGNALRVWLANTAGCLAFIAAVVVFVAALLYALQGRLW